MREQTTGRQDAPRLEELPAETLDSWPKLRHALRNYLNTIRLTAALLQRQHQADPLLQESVRDIEKAVDQMNELIGRYVGDVTEVGAAGLLDKR